jgi:hypothetical protein
MFHIKWQPSSVDVFCKYLVAGLEHQSSLLKYSNKFKTQLMQPSIHEYKVQIYATSNGMNFTLLSKKTCQLELNVWTDNKSSLTWFPKSLNDKSTMVLFSTENIAIIIQ